LQLALPNGRADESELLTGNAALSAPFNSPKKNKIILFLFE